MTSEQFTKGMQKAYAAIQKCNRGTCAVVGIHVDRYKAAHDYRHFVVEIFGQKAQSRGIPQAAYGKWSYDLKQGLEADSVQFIRLVALAMFWDKCINDKSYLEF